jgi:hypothetical protein
MESWRIQVGEDGYVQIPPDLCDFILKSNRIRSKKTRIQKKIIKKVFIQALYDSLEKMKSE